MDVVFPCLDKVFVEQVGIEGGVVRIRARTRDGVVLPCPDCGVPSGRVHSRYRRHPADAAVGGRDVVIDLSVRRLFCDVHSCPRQTFVEQVEGLTIRYGRYTPLLLRLLQAVGVALAGRAGARLLAVMHPVVSRVTLLALVMALPDPPWEMPEALGVDDFALRRGGTYGTVLVDMATHQVLDLLPGREADPLAAWLTRHPGVLVICRDRAGAYTQAATRAAPQAVQVADRWHLWHNLGQHAEKDVAQHQGCLHRAAATADAPTGGAGIEDLPAQALSAQGVLEARTRRRYREVHALLEQGWAMAEVARELHLNFKTVKTFARAPAVQDVLGHIAGRRPSKLDPQRQYLLARWAEGCHSPTVLHQEMAERGVTCNIRLITRYLRTLQVGGHLPAPGPAAPKTRKLVGWIMRHPTALDSDERQHLSTALAACPELGALHRHVQAFAEIMAKREGQYLHTWVEQVRTDNLPALGAFASGLEKDWDAVTAGLTLAWSSGAVEGAVNIRSRCSSGRPTARQALRYSGNASS
ncbi:MAG TPA: ISL3 family transposase [Actinocrinis sp.]|nr:ISL3 family transposase [Actinocrinis sp.]